MKRNIFVFFLTVALLIACLSVSAMAAEGQKPEDLNQISAYAAQTMASLFTDTDHVKTYCPVCKKDVDWYALETPFSQGGILDPTYHWFLKKDVAHNGGYYIAKASTSICLYLNGKNLTSTSVVFGVYGTLNIIGNGPEIVSGSNYGNYSQIGATVDLGQGTLNLFGGTFTKASTTNAGPVIGYTGKGTMNIYDGTTISGGKNTAEGGNIGIYYSGATLNMYGGTVTGGQALGGGNIGTVKTDSVINIYGGLITAGESTSKGGNIYSKSPVNIYGGAISGGVAASGGGNIYTDGGANLSIGTETGSQVRITGGNSGVGQGGSVACGGNTQIRNTLISGGNSGKAWGGNLYIDSYRLDLGPNTVLENGNGSGGGNLAAYAATLSFDGVTFKDGYSNNTGTRKNGGNMYLWKCNMTVANSTVSGGNQASIYLLDNMSCEFTNTIIQNGTAGTGGNFYLSSGPLTLTNCTVSGGTATSGGNIFNGGTLVLNNTNLTSTATNNIFSDGAMTINGGQIQGVVYARKGLVTLDGAAQMNDLQLDMHTLALANLKVENTFTGNVVITSMACMPAAPFYGTKLASNYTATGDFAGKVVLSFVAERPWLYHDNGALAICTARTQKGGENTWFKDNAAAVAGYGNADVLIPAPGVLALTGGTYVVDLAGQDLQITGTGNVRLLDSANRDYKTYGEATVNGPAVLNQTAETVLGDTYYMVRKGGKYSVHLLEVKITGVAVRPSVSGMYFSSAWSCDDLLKEQIQTAGVAVSLAHQPGADFAQDAKTLYTQFAPTAQTSGTSVLIKDIFKSGLENNGERGQMPVYATAYVILSDGQTQLPVLSKVAVSRSLRDVMKKIDGDLALYGNNKTAVDGFYKNWSAVMESWQLSRIGKSLSDGESLKLLAISSSFGVNTTEALYDIAMAEGATDVTVARLYASGCTLQQHFQNAQSGTGAYQYSKISTATGGAWSTRNNTSLLTGLQDEQWDIIFIQQSAHEANQAQYIDELLAYVNANKPENAKLVWNMTWAFAKNSNQAKFHDVFHGDQSYMYEQIRNMARDNAGAREDVFAVIPTGTAIQNVRTSYIGHNLTKDTYHLNNMGRVIAGYTLWGAITGKPLTQISLDSFASGWDHYDGMGEAITLSNQDKQVILESVNAALADPYKVTESSYPAQQEDDVLRILMIGNSYCFYHVEELYDLLASDGIKAQVCNVYYSGCPMVSHYKWWVDGISNYEYYVTDENGRRQPAGRKVSLEYCLAQEDWDVISIQESLFRNYPFDSAEQILANNQVYRDALIPYIQQRFPNADVYWRENWAAEIGFARNDLTITAQIQETFSAKEEAAAKAIAQQYGIKYVNNAAAWAIARQSDLVTDLCKRAGIAEFGGENSGDGYHDGDIGGGQYLNACLWYEILTGKSSVGKAFHADTLGYDLSAELVAVLQNAAHQAAQELLAQ